MARKMLDVNDIELLFVDNSIYYQSNFLVALDIILEYEEDSKIDFEINKESILGECISISSSSSNCIISTEFSGKLLSSNKNFKITSIEAATPGKHLDVNLVEVPLELSISSAYPNPFNPSVRFDYSLPFESYVEISVYNIHGQLVSQLINSSMESGKYNIEWNAKSYSSGVYFVNFNINNVNSVQRVTLIK